ncbi:hypothetical protein BGZ61DRAFT_479961 [Ilyonectria robusta]|uniref:uncharacterized protein n=1 Tax=Ilyonectria robusta TaxID=1079257 RepID=UPI001E8E9BCF|nr:uncharacterized protein BGZ61DRAFT_479961 [Ilyonectria robusta]KAH8685201.1 hypothetical protein BGZ61DRAFT_479961 [Ilyonectria robusta]
MPRWGVGTTDTTKVSIEMRYMLADRIQAMLDDLMRLRVRAIQRASPSDIGIFAIMVPLPRPEEHEEEELYDLWSRSDFPWLYGEDAIVPCADEDYTIDFAFGDPAECQGIPVDEIAFDAESDSDDDHDYDDAGAHDQDTRYEDWFSNRETPTRSPSPQHESDCSDIDPETRGPNQSDEAKHTLLLPWSQSFPEDLKSHLDRVEADDNQNVDGSSSGNCCTTRVSEPCHPTSASPSDSPNANYKTPFQSLCDSTEPHNYYTISAEQLVRLQSCIELIGDLHDSALRSIRDVKAALNRREARHRLRASGGDFTRFMKSRGLGTPLVNVIAIDEVWPDTEWDAPTWKPPRKKICYGTRRPVGPPAAGI